VSSTLLLTKDGKDFGIASWIYPYPELEYKLQKLRIIRRRENGLRATAVLNSYNSIQNNFLLTRTTSEVKAHKSNHCTNKDKPFNNRLTTSEKCKLTAHDLTNFVFIFFEQVSLQIESANLDGQLSLLWKTSYIY
jgi:hypothetical protein